FLLTVDSASADPAVVGAALIAGWRSGLAESAPFSRWTSARDDEVRWRAVYALTRRRFADVVPLLRTLLVDDDPRVRSMALRGLHGPLLEQAGASAAEVAGQVLPLLEDSTYSVRVEAVR